MFDLWFQNRNIIFYCIPKVVRVYSIVAMNKDMAHAFHSFPFYFGVGATEFFCKHICRFANNFYLLHDNTLLILM